MKINAEFKSRNARSNRCWLDAKKVLESYEFASAFLKQGFTQLPDEFEKFTNMELLSTLEAKISFAHVVVDRPWYKSYSSAIGWTVITSSPPWYKRILGAKPTTVNTIYTYYDSFTEMTDAELSAHLAHEFSHLCGHSHSFYDNSDREMSVPYWIGGYVEKVLGGK